MLTTWLYVSVPAIPDGRQPDVIDELCAVSRRRNADLGVTGALIFTRSHFAQQIEGPAESVALLRAKIERDPRHRDVRTLQASRVERREYTDWTLAYSGRSTFVDRELRRITGEASNPHADAVLRLTTLLTEFARADGVGGARANISTG